MKIASVADVKAKFSAYIKESEKARSSSRATGGPSPSSRAYRMMMRSSG